MAFATQNISLITDAIARTKHYGKHVLRMDDYDTKEQVDALVEIASYLDPIWKTGGVSHFLSGKVMLLLFFEPSTRTRVGSITSMLRLGGTVIDEATPLVTTRLTTISDFPDTLKTISLYVDIITMRHPNSEEAIQAIEEGANVPVLSGGFGGYEHPIAGYTDLFTTLKICGRLENLKVLIIGASHSNARAAHSYAMGIAKYSGNQIMFATEKDAANPPEIVEDLKKKGVIVKEVFSPTKEQVYELIRDADIVYLSALGYRTGLEPENKDAVLDKFGGQDSAYYISLDMMERIKKETGKVVSLLHPFPRYPHLEMDHALDKTEFAGYWKEMDYAQPVRMGMILSMIYPVV